MSDEGWGPRRTAVNDPDRPVVVSGMNDAMGDVLRFDRLPVTAALPVDPAAEVFRDLSSRHLDTAYRLAWAILGDGEDAADATQDAFAAAWRQRASLRDPSCFEAWLGRILINTCRDRLRQRARRTPSAGFDAEGGPWIGDASGVTSTRDELDRALARLDPDHRVVVILRFWADLTVDDIAARTGIPSGTVKSRLHKAMRVLRAALEETA